MKRLSSRIAYQNPWMKVREDAIELADGSPSIYGVVEKPDFAVVAAIRSGRLVLVEQGRYAAGKRLLEFPQGAKFDEDRFDAEAVARAELREETGYTAGRMLALGSFYQAVGYATQRAHAFLALDLVPGPTDRELGEHDMTVVEVEIAEFEVMIRDGRIEESCTMAAWALVALDPAMRALASSA